MHTHGGPCNLQQGWQEKVLGQLDEAWHTQEEKSSAPKRIWILTYKVLWNPGQTEERNILPMRLSKCIIIYFFLLQICTEPVQGLSCSQPVIIINILVTSPYKDIQAEINLDEMIGYLEFSSK